MRYRKFFISLVVFSCTCTAVASAQVLAVVQQKFQHFRQNHLQEKLFIHTDKDFYLAGEIIWCKLYTVDASFHKPLDISKVAYVELVDTANRPVLQAKIGLNKGSGNGSL